jgi:hypothetical protein
LEQTPLEQTPMEQASPTSEVRLFALTGGQPLDSLTDARGLTTLQSEFSLCIHRCHYGIVDTRYLLLKDLSFTHLILIRGVWHRVSKSVVRLRQDARSVGGYP